MLHEKAATDYQSRCWCETATEPIQEGFTDLNTKEEIMKKQILILVGVLSLMLAAGSAFAQSVNLNADIPFGFVMAKQTMPAGHYTIKSVSERVLSLQGPDGKPVAMIIAHRVESAKPAENSKLVFQRYGDRYFLAQVWTSGNNAGEELPKSPRESEIALDTQPQQVVVLASLR
jgi:hypothetical protein